VSTDTWVLCDFLRWLHMLLSRECFLSQILFPMIKLTMMTLCLHCFCFFTQGKGVEFKVREEIRGEVSLKQDPDSLPVPRAEMSWGYHHHYYCGRLQLGKVQVSLENMIVFQVGHSSLSLSLLFNCKCV
jgi:hypothetical protein